MLVLLLLLQLKVPDAAQFVGQPKGQPLAGQQLYRETQRVGALLRCPVCQGMSVADSPSEMAVNMKAQVHELLSRGYTEEQILDYFEQSYGQFVLLEPKFEGVTGMVWIMPVIVLLIGVGIVFMKLRSLKQQPQLNKVEPVSGDDPYLAKVRDLVEGGKN